MRNGKKHEMMPFFLVAFYNMRAVTFVLPDEIADVSIKRLQWFILIPRLNHTGSHRPVDSHSIPYLHREKIKDLEQELPSLLQSYKLRGKQPFVSDFSRLLRRAIEKGRGPILYSKKKPGTPRGYENTRNKKYTRTKRNVYNFKRFNVMFIVG